MEVPFAFRINEKENLWITSDKSDSSPRIDLGATKTAQLGLENQFVDASAVACLLLYHLIIACFSF